MAISRMCMRMCIFGIIVETLCILFIGYRLWTDDFYQRRRHGVSKSVITMAKSISKERNPVLITVVNRAYLPLVNNWLCNTEWMDIHRQTLIITTEVESRRLLQDRWPLVSVETLELSRLEQELHPGTVRHFRFGLERARAILQLLEAGVQLLQFEVDSTWFSNTLPSLLAFRQGVDILLTTTEGHSMMASWLLLLNPNPATVGLWRRFVGELDRVSTTLRGDRAEIDESVKDTELFWELMTERFANVTVAFLPEATFKDGEWYGLPDVARARKPHPLVIMNNFYKGVHAKIQRAKRFDYWFLKEGSVSNDCNASAVNAVLRLNFTAGH